MAGKRILIVEDERDIADLVAMRLKREKYDVEIAGDGLEGLRKIRSSPPDLVLLDLMLPKMSGVEVTAELRKDPSTADVPILMLTAKSEESDIVVGLHVGADDYVTKPFSMSVLLARIAALLRRSETTGKDRPKREELLHAGPITIDEQRHHVNVDGKPIQLTLTEFRLLVAVVTGKGRVLTRDQLINKGMGVDAVVTDRTIDVHVTSLRRKLGSARKYVETVRGVGYRLASVDHEES
ncbi:MAG: response regulator transcription factor [Phycisphaerae bacterium]|nr:response regulator transcription factor [Phycisphaerae bacterium]